MTLALVSEATAAEIFSCPERSAAKKNTAYVTISETAVEDVATPTRKANARRLAIAKRMTTPPSRKRGCATPVFQTTIAQIEPIRYRRLAAASSRPPAYRERRSFVRPIGRER